MSYPLKTALKEGVNCRSRHDSDIPFLRLLYSSTRAREVSASGWPLEAQQAFLNQQFDAQHQHYTTHYPDAQWLVLTLGEEAVGRLYIEEWSQEIRVIDLALISEFRGRGIGTALLRDIQAEAVSKSKWVSIHVEKYNPALRLYLRLGFQIIDEHGIYDLLEWRPQAGVAS